MLTRTLKVKIPGLPFCDTAFGESFLKTPILPYLGRRIVLMRYLLKIFRFSNQFDPSLVIYAHVFSHQALSSLNSTHLNSDSDSNTMELSLGGISTSKAVGWFGQAKVQITERDLAK